MHPDELDARTLIYAYAHGLFPMPDEHTGEIQWYRPDPRAILPLDGFHTSRSLARVLRAAQFEVRINTCFQDVMRACADRKETWITDAMIRAYSELHELQRAHSVEIFRNNKLVGGVYGVALGAAFFAESMFHREDNMSKVALRSLVDHLNKKSFQLLECQFLTPHLARLGAIEIPGELYTRWLKRALAMGSIKFI